MAEMSDLEKRLRLEAEKQKDTKVLRVGNATIRVKRITIADLLREDEERNSKDFNPDDMD